jgi:ATP-dependent RNA helicase MSS116
MFKASLQRHARLGNVARRQISTFSSLRAVRIQTFEQHLSSNNSILLAKSRPAFLTQLAPRFYSSEAAAESTEDDASYSASSSGPVTRFADLASLDVHPKLVDAIVDGMKYEDMTEVQSKTINQALRGVDLYVQENTPCVFRYLRSKDPMLTIIFSSVAQAKTGTGKTLAFLVPTFQRLLVSHPELADTDARRRASSDDVKAIIMSPTRELAEQIGAEAKKLARGTGIVVQTAVGGTRKREALWKMQSEGCHILVATPGRLQDLLSDPDANVSAPALKAFVLDEADRMLDVGFADAIRDILDLLPPVSKVDRQTLLFSATIPRDVVHLAKSLVKTDNFEFVQTIKSDDAPTHEKVPQHIVPCNGYENWFPTILEIADKGMEKSKSDPTTCTPFKAIVFFSNTATVEFAYTVFRSTSLGALGGIPLFDIHSKLGQHQRTRNAEAFRRSTTGILFSSDVTARGMDFPGVTHVIQVGLPPSRDQYIHRLGRTGRAGAEGQGWLLLAQEEIDEARARLPGLPIKPNNTIESAKHQLGKSTAPAAVQKYFDEVARGYGVSPSWEFTAVYHALIGQQCGRRLRVNDVVALVNNWALQGIGRDEVPAISARTAQNRNLSRIPGIRIGHDQDLQPSRPEGRGFGGSRGSGGFGDRGRGGYGGSRGGDRGGDSFGDRFNSRSDRGSDRGRGGFSRRTGF